MMNKKYFYSVSLILLVLFNIVAFVVPTDRTSSFWVAYSLTTVGFLIAFFTFVIFNKKDNLEGKFLKIPSLAISLIQIFLQLVFFIIVLIFPSIKVWVVVLFNAVVLCSSLILIILSTVSKDKIVAVETKIDSDIFFIKKAKCDVEIVLSRETDATKRNVLENLISKLKYSDPVSIEELKDVEEQIEKKIAQLKSNVSDKLINEILMLLEQRNKLCKFYKKRRQKNGK